MSKFFTKVSASESDESSSEDETTPKSSGIVLKQTSTRNLSLSDDEEKRVARSAKDKNSDKLTNYIKNIRNAMKIHDMAKCLEEFEKLCRTFDKGQALVVGEEAPSFYIRILAELEDHLNQIWEDKEGKKRLNKNNAKALSTLRQKIRKYNVDNPELHNMVVSYRKNPQMSADKEEEELGSSTDAEDESLLKTSPAEPTPDVTKDSGDEDDSSPESLEADEEDSKGGWVKVKGGVPPSRKIAEKPQMFPKSTSDINTVQDVVEKLKEIMQSRGKKSTDRAAQVELLHQLEGNCKQNKLGVGILFKVKYSIAVTIFDYKTLEMEAWLKGLKCIEELLDLLFKNNIIFGENITEDNEILDMGAVARDPKTCPPSNLSSESESDQPDYRIHGCILTLVERLDEDFTKLMQDTDPHSQEYVNNLKYEYKVFGIIKSLSSYLEKKGSPAELCRVYLHYIMHIYYKCNHKTRRHHVLGDHGESTFKRKDQEDEIEGCGDRDSAAVMDRLCKFIYANDRTDRIRTYATLCQIYHHALHLRWYQARDLMLMSHLQDNIQHSDPPIQILYNRAMVQLGICAFDQGLIKDAHNALLDIQPQAKVLLGQGLQTTTRHGQERNAEQEKTEKRRLVPFHMHVNTELLECVYLVSAMLLEIPCMAAREFDARKKTISKPFYHQLRLGEKQPLLGPPDAVREHVVAASKAMKMGDWHTCLSFIVNDKMNSRVWRLFPNPQRVRGMITGKIREESLRTYLFTYSSVYDSISMETMSVMFELEPPAVHSIVSKMIVNEELMASLDQPSQMVVMHRVTPLQNMVLQLAEKLGCLVDNNDRLSKTRDQRGGYQQKLSGYQRGAGHQLGVGQNN